MRVCPGAQLLFAGRLGDAGVVQVGLLACGDRFGIEHQTMIVRVQRHVLVAGEDLVAAVLLYHLVSVAVMCIFSMMFRQPMPVL